MPKDIDNNDYVAEYFSKQDREYIAEIIREELLTLFHIRDFVWSNISSIINIWAFFNLLISDSISSL